nr:hypothetical protein [Brevibacillus laterosporus]
MYKEFPEMRGSEQIIFLEPSKQSQKSEYYIEFRKRKKDKVTLYRDVSIDSQNGLLLLYRDNLSSEDDKNVATPKEIALKRAKAQTFRDILCHRNMQKELPIFMDEFSCAKSPSWFYFDYSCDCYLHILHLTFTNDIISKN